MSKPIRVRNIDSNLYRKFKAKCAAEGLKVYEAIALMMERFIKGK